MFKKTFILSSLLLLFAASMWTAQIIPFDYLWTWIAASVLIGFIGRKIIMDTANYLYPLILEKDESLWASKSASVLMLILGTSGFIIFFVPFFGIFILLYIWSYVVRDKNRFKKEYAAFYGNKDLWNNNEDVENIKAKIPKATKNDSGPFIIIFQNCLKPYYIASWDGDAGRVRKIEYAQKFETIEAAETFRLNALINNPLRFQMIENPGEVITLSSILYKQ